MSWTARCPRNLPQWALARWPSDRSLTSCLYVVEFADEKKNQLSSEIQIRLDSHGRLQTELQRCKAAEGGMSIDLIHV